MNITISTKKIVILGAGISGLTSAYFLNKKGMEVTVLEKKNEAGGSIESEIQNDFLFEHGPNSALETSLLTQLIENLNLKDDQLYANKRADKRYILKNNKLVPLPMSPQAFFGSNLFSLQAKLRVLKEPFASKSKDGYYESVSEFVQRRLGKEFLDYAVDPFISGVYAGDPDQLSVKAAFPKLYELGEKYGGLIIGTIKSMRQRKKKNEKPPSTGKMFSFKNGMQTLPNALASSLKEKIIFLSEVISIKKNNGNYKIVYNHAGAESTLLCENIISTLPAYSAAELFKNIDENLYKHLIDIYYPPVLVLYLTYKKEDIKIPLDGFGFLIPSKENKSFLGAIWNSVIFQNRASKDTASFTLFAGGSRNPEIGKTDKEIIIKKIKNEFEEIMKINGEPILTSYKFWNRAIPQYNTGYIEHENYFKEFEKNNPGIILSGSYRGGISIGDCINTGKTIFNKLNFSVSAP